MAEEKENTRNKLNKPDPKFLFMVIPPLDLFGLVPKLLDSGICISFSIRHSEEQSDAVTIKENAISRKSNQSRTFVIASNPVKTNAFFLMRSPRFTHNDINHIPLDKFLFPYSLMSLAVMLDHTNNSSCTDFAEWFFSLGKHYTVQHGTVEAFG